MVPVVPPNPGSPLGGALPAAGLPAEALQSLARAFGREVRTRLPLLLVAARGGQPSESARADAHRLAEGCALLGDAAGATALRHLGGLLSGEPGSADPLRCAAAADQAALLLGRWVRDDPAQT